MSSSRSSRSRGLPSTEEAAPEPAPAAALPATPHAQQSNGPASSPQHSPRPPAYLDKEHQMLEALARCQMHAERDRLMAAAASSAAALYDACAFVLKPPRGVGAGLHQREELRNALSPHFETRASGSILHRLAAGHHQRFLQLCFWRVCCCGSGPAALNSWMCTLVWRSGRLSSMAAFSTTFRTGRRWPRWPLDHLLRDRPVFRRLKVCSWRASNSPGIQC